MTDNYVENINASTTHGLQPWGDTSWADKNAETQFETRSTDLELHSDSGSVFVIEFKSEHPELSPSLRQRLGRLLRHWGTSTEMPEFVPSSFILHPSVVFKETGILPGSATVPYDPPQELKERFDYLFALAKEEVFEDGMESEFSRSLVTLIEKYQDAALEVLTELIIGGNMNPEIASEALRWIGHIENPVTHRARLKLLEHGLFSPSARIRDGAILGLASMDDPRAMRSLEQAIEDEEVPELHDDMMDVLEQLRDTLLEG